MIRLFGRPSGPTHPTGPAGPGPTGPAGPSPSGPVGPHPSPSGPPSPSPTSGTGAPWPARPGGSSGPGGPAGPGRAQGEQLAAVAGLLSLVIEFATALPLPSSSLGRAAKGLLIAYLRLADRMVTRIAVHDGVTIPGRGGEGAQWSAPSRPVQSTSGVEVRPAPGCDVAPGSATPGSGRAVVGPVAGARAGGGPHAVPGAPPACDCGHDGLPEIFHLNGCPLRVRRRVRGHRWDEELGRHVQYDSLPGMQAGVADYGRRP